MDQADLGMRDFDRLLEDARRALAEMQTRSSDPGERDETTTLRGEGMSASGQIRATVVTGGRLESVRVDPRAMRLGSEALGEEVVAAVNAALDDLRVKAQEAAPAMPDRAALGQQLEELRTESVRRMQLFTQGVAEAVEQISQAAEGGRG